MSQMIRSPRRTLTLLLAVLATAGLSVGLTSSASARPAGTSASPIVVVARRPALPPNLPKFSVTLPDIPKGSTFRPAEVLAGFGCTGGNQSPAIAWNGAPAGTVSYLITLFDLDAPTGAGFWHWAVWNIPGQVHALPGGAGTAGRAGPGRLRLPRLRRPVPARR